MVEKWQLPISQGRSKMHKQIQDTEVSQSSRPDMRDDAGLIGKQVGSGRRHKCSSNRPKLGGPRQGVSRGRGYQLSGSGVMIITQGQSRSVTFMKT